MDSNSHTGNANKVGAQKRAAVSDLSVERHLVCFDAKESAYVQTTVNFNLKTTLANIADGCRKRQYRLLQQC